VIEGGDKILSVEGDGTTASRVEARVRLAARSLELRCRANAAALPFFDGTFDDATLRCPHSWFDREAAERAAREIERVVRPEGLVSIRVTGVRSAHDRRRIERALGRAGVEGDFDLDQSSESLRVRGRRRSGVSAETWRSLGGGASATAWNDEMFAFQRTPYDPRTIAGRIFLRRVHWIADYVGQNSRGRVLEVGCEAGGLLRHLPAGFQIVGLDLSRAALRSARSALARTNIAFVHADATRALPFPEESFDYVIASEVLEHCRSPHRVIANLHGALKRDGRAIVSIPNERRYLKWKSWLTRVPLARRALRGIEEGPAAWHIHHDFDREKLDSLIDGFFEVERETSIWGTTLIAALRKI